MTHQSIGNEVTPGGIVHRCSCGWVSRPCFSNMIASIEGQEHRDAAARNGGVAPARKITSLDEFFAEAERTGFTAADLAEGLRARGVPATPPDNRTRPLTDSSQRWTPEHCKTYPRRASEEIEYLRGQLAAHGVEGKTE